MARRSIDFLCMLSQPRNLIDFPLYIYPFEDRGCREIRFRACGIDQKLWIFHRFDQPKMHSLLRMLGRQPNMLSVGTLEGHIKISSNSMLKVKQADELESIRTKMFLRFLSIRAKAIQMVENGEEVDGGKISYNGIKMRSS
ncbi:hypothetical protein LXL04_039888 [Taraxacum kok-saghyz]